MSHAIFLALTAIPSGIFGTHFAGNYRLHSVATGSKVSSRTAS
jgi:hypothetical protein